MKVTVEIGTRLLHNDTPERKTYYVQKENNLVQFLIDNRNNNFGVWICSYHKKLIIKVVLWLICFFSVLNSGQLRQPFGLSQLSGHQKYQQNLQNSFQYNENI